MQHLNRDQATPHEQFGLPPQEVIDARTDALVMRAIPWLAEPPRPETRRVQRARLRGMRGTRKKVYVSASVTLVILAVTASIGAVANNLRDADPAWATPAPTARTAPTPGVGSADYRVLAPIPQGSSDAFGLQHPAVPGQQVVGFDPCRTIPYVIQTQGAPEGAAEMIRRAAERVSAASGLAFEYAGETDETPAAESRSPYQPERYGDRWAPVLIAWDANLLPEGESGDTESVAMQAGESPFAYVSGQVVLDGALLGDWEAEEGGDQFVDAVVMAQLARLVGLAEVDAPGQLLSAGFGGERLDFGEGDLAGLALVGSGQCVPEL